ncbi:ASCH domain-containing protein [Streptomyces sp. NPDC046925]|uniref:ASCH domain-containing protein n=1 Tax=Streptomyces sp. NPDC046925 TaxID=3155375 RepID=UPI0033E07334
MRALELGTPGPMRAELNALVLAGHKVATTGLLAEYGAETEGLEYASERLALLGNDGQAVATVEITGVEIKPFGEVTWEHARAEGEGDTSLEEWRNGHRAFWEASNSPVDEATLVVCLAFKVVSSSG